MLFFLNDHFLFKYKFPLACIVINLGLYPADILLHLNCLVPLLYLIFCLECWLLRSGEFELFDTILNST